ncbi:alcohol dehydrogenase catalytic domain-containing protein [Variovorax sp. GT1P44]|uniref:alcohol dehydrogenase catalytic domain-containing protein n=1 Tax=Variovorax sp. GT1P44 TaxID=3443742 RepID=UPI003F45F650
MASSTNLSRRIVQYGFGDPHAVLQVEDDVAVPSLSAGEVRVRVSRSIIHPGDLQIIEGRYSRNAPAIPAGRVPGLEAVGVIEDAAPHALDGTGMAFGTRVAFFAPGAWQSRATVPAGSLLAVPDDLSDSVATQILINTIAARHVLRAGLRALPAASNHILLTGAASAVAKLIAAFAVADGQTPIRLVRSRQSAERLVATSPGGHIIDTSSRDWQHAVRSVSDGDLQIAFDGVGGALLGEVAELLGIGGTVIFYGALAGAMASLPLFVSKSLKLVGVTIGTWYGDTTPQVRSEDMAAAIQIARTNPQLFDGYQEFDLGDLDAAIDAVSVPGKTGNVLLNF